MISNFIPFLLTVHLFGDNGTWEHGPEYTFNADLSLSVVNATHVLYVGIKTTPICQPKDSDTISCRLTSLWFGETMDDVTQTEPLTRRIIYPNMSENMILEIKFDEEGVKHYVFPKNESFDFYVTSIPLIDALNIRTSTINRTEEVFSDNDKFFLGECKTNYKITSSGYLYPFPKDDKTYEFNFESSVVKNLTRNVHATRNRELEHCSIWKKDNYILPNVLHKYSEHVHSLQSTNRALITHENFMSRSQLSMSMLRNNDSVTAAGVEWTVTLQSVSPAKQKFSSIPDPKEYSIYEYPQETGRVNFIDLFEPPNAG